MDVGRTEKENRRELIGSAAAASTSVLALKWPAACVSVLSACNSPLPHLPVMTDVGVRKLSLWFDEHTDSKTCERNAHQNNRQYNKLQ